MKMFYTIGEVAEMLGVNTSLLRFWETKFPQLKPSKTTKGQRTYTQKDIDLLKRIYHLTKECGYTLEGALMQIRQRRGASSAEATTAAETATQTVESAQAPQPNSTPAAAPTAEGQLSLDTLLQPTRSDEAYQRLLHQKDAAMSALRSLRRELVQLKAMLHAE